MKNLLHTDYWVEVPAGKFLVGLSMKQRSTIIERMHELGMYANLSTQQLQLLEIIRQKWSKSTESITEWFRTSILTEAGDYNFPAIDLTKEENDLYLNGQLMSAFYIERNIHGTPLETEIYLDRFYIARFPVTRQQYLLFNRKTTIDSIAGVLDPEHEEGEYKRGARVDPETSLRFCSEIGGRLPTKKEWEKAARGVDGRLYPWGNEWDFTAGYFYYGQPDPVNAGNRVDSYPKGVSPYGVWRMVGSEPELVTNIKGYVIAKGHHPKESSAETAWLDHIVTASTIGGFVSLRPVLDQWPTQQWRGYKAGEDETS